MASFYNPYMKTPDYSQGANGIMQQIMQILMMKQMMGGQQGQQSVGTTPTGLPQLGGQYSMQSPQSQAPGSMSSQGQMDPQVFAQLMKLFQGGGFMGGGTGSGGGGLF